MCIIDASLPFPVLRAASLLAGAMDALHVDEFPEARRRVVGEVSSLASGKAGPVLYWMSRDQRVQGAKLG